MGDALNFLMKKEDTALGYKSGKAAGQGAEAEAEPDLSRLENRSI